MTNFIIISPHSVLVLSPLLMQFNGGFVCFVVVGLLLASGTKVMSKSIALESMTLPYQALACPPITTIYLELVGWCTRTTIPPPQRERRVYIYTSYHQQLLLCTYTLRTQIVDNVLNGTYCDTQRLSMECRVITKYFFCADI